MLFPVVHPLGDYIAGKRCSHIGIQDFLRFLLLDHLNSCALHVAHCLKMGYANWGLEGIPRIQFSITSMRDMAGCPMERRTSRGWICIQVGWLHEWVKIRHQLPVPWKTCEFVSLAEIHKADIRIVPAYYHLHWHRGNVVRIHIWYM